jgi:glycerophosphoryl diester phosphodiesterase
MIISFVIVFSFFTYKVINRNPVIRAIKEGYIELENAIKKTDRPVQIDIINFSDIRTISGKKYVLNSEFTQALNAINIGAFWTYYRLVAHAGGALIDNSEIHTYTNSYEAIAHNYQMGHRVFEIDFNLTRDGKLAAVHDWEDNIVIPTMDEWKKQKIKNKYTTMDIDDVLSFMYIHKDVFLITDVKFLDPKDIHLQFAEIYNSAKKYDVDILNRIIPQIYFPEMLSIIDEIYNFPSVIYTLYRNDPSPKSVVDFVKQHDNVQVVAMWPYKATEEFVRDLASTGKLVYTHTINNVTELLDCYNLGIYGFYTDYLY